LLLATIYIYHRQKEKEKKGKEKKKNRKKKPERESTLLYIFLACHELFLQFLFFTVFSHVLFCNALPTAAAFYPLCDWQFLMGAKYD